MNNNYQQGKFVYLKITLTLFEDKFMLIINKNNNFII